MYNLHSSCEVGSIIAKQWYLYPYINSHYMEMNDLTNVRQYT